MKTKIIQFIPALIALVIICFRLFSQWCIVTSSLCYGTWIHQIYLEVTNPFFYFTVLLLPVTIVLVFIPQSIFNSLLKLAVWMVPLSIIFIVLTPDSNPGAYMDFFPFYRDDAARLAGGVFAVASLILIIWRALRSAHAK